MQFGSDYKGAPLGINKSDQEKTLIRTVSIDSPVGRMPELIPSKMVWFKIMKVSRGR